MNIERIIGLNPVESVFSPEKDGTAQAQGTSFKDVMRDAVMRIEENEAAGAKDTSGLILGDVSDLHTMMINQSSQALAVETAVQLTSRAVSAYKEIMQMQI